MSDYPEHEKLEKTSVERNAVGEFLEWAEENGLQLMAVDDGRPYSVNWQDKMADWLDVDLVKLEQEKRAMFAPLRQPGQGEGR